MVFLHGLMGSATNWRSITGFFEKNFHIMTYDQRGHGGSFHPKTNYLPSDYAKDFDQIMQDLGWNSCFLVGHSMGGRNALCAAALFPKRVRALVLEDISLTPRPEIAEETERLINLVPTPFSSRSEARDFFFKKLPALLRERSNAKILVPYLYMNMKENSKGCYDWKFLKQGIIDTLYSGRRHDGWADLIQIKCPTLIIRGGVSQEISDSELEKITKKQPLATHHTIDGAGHWVHFDKPDEFKSCLSKFFSQF